MEKLIDIQQGLTAADVRERIARGEVNTTTSKTSRSLGSIIRENVFTAFNAILATAAVLILVFGHVQDAVFAGVMIFNAVIGITSEIRAKRTLDSLAIVDAPRARVRRDGSVVEVPASQVVLDEVILIELGDQICADGVVAASGGLEVDESILTGESEPVKKQEGDPLLAGTSVVSGSATMRATTVGDRVYAQDLARRARVYSPTVSQIQTSIDRVLKVISALLLPMIALTIWSQTRIAEGADWSGAIVLAVASVVGMIPQGLVLLTSMNFAIGSATLARRGVLVQELPAVEVLARVDALCTDKTGTLTTGRIAVRELSLFEEAPEEAGAALAALTALSSNETSRAIERALEQDLPALEPEWSVPFSSARKWAAIGTGSANWYLGAPEILLPEGPSTELGRRIDSEAASGRRVVVLVAAAPSAPTEELAPQRRPLGLVILEEELRSDAAETMAYFEEQGIRLRVISGDNALTVGALAQRAGLHRPDGGELRVVDARELPDDHLSDEFADAVEGADVFGRVTPEQKRAMVQALQARGHCVAMTGDGVNDALALKDADLGIAMGEGARATKAVAQIVLVDSRFSVLPGVLAEGRRIIANMERVAALFLSKTVYAAITVIAIAIAAAPYPFLPRHFTYIGAFTIGIPAFALALAPNARRYVPGFLSRILSLAVPAGIGLAVASLSAYHLVGVGTVEGRTAATLALMIGALWLLSITARPLVGWRILLLAAMGAMAALGVLVPVTRDFFALAVPTPGQWAVIVVAGVLAGAAIEAAYRMLNRRLVKRAEEAGRA
ncbi:HAD-IC family P-type ATPase [Schaalia hyovaginalis]|uniref:Cation-transporting ATPase E n=1 Tax=Schaalia hyovaginalis TaxID=29316 RepID=A0A923E714_9ACTO|nr:cation-transporting ATPase E [Schaalia hyovaginalis]